MRWTSLLILGPVLGGLVILACGADARDPFQPTQQQPDGSAAGTDTGPGIIPPGNDGNPGFTDASTVDANKIDEHCAADTQAGKQSALDLYLMVDTSGSMADQTQSGTTKWDAMKAALKAFVDDAASAGLGVGIQFFPVFNPAAPATCTTTQCGATGPCWFNKICASQAPNNITYCAADSDCNNVAGDCQDLGQCFGFGTGACLTSSDCFLGTCQKPLLGYCKLRDSCTPSDYATPKVAWSTLPAAAPGIKSALDGITVDGFTPTGPALQGAVDAAKAQLQANPTHTVVVILATDGLPSECAPQDIPAIAAIAAGGAAAGVKTFAIGVFAPEEQIEAQANLNQIAASGGSGQAFVVSTGSNVTQSVQQALNAIRGAALPCDFSLPIPESGTPDYTKVNVQYTDGNGMPSTILYVGSAGTCDPNTGGWYYDVDPATGTPTRVIVCPKTCEGFKADGKAKVEIVQGCETIKVK